MSPARAFAAVFLLVFLIIFGGSALITFLLPETYTASARVRAPSTSQLDLLRSTELLGEVSGRLRLPEKFAAQYGEKEPLEPRRVEDLLRRSIRVRRVPGTELVEIRVTGRNPEECAELANGIAEAGVRRAAQGKQAVEIVDKAVPPSRPSRPNKALNLTLGAIVGAFLGIMAGGVGAKLAVGFDDPSSKTSSPR